MIYLANAFSVSMLRYPEPGCVRSVTIERIPAFTAGEFLRTHKYHSVYGHGSTAWHLERYLRIRVPVRREAITLEEGDTLIVARAGMDRAYRSGERKAPKWAFFRILIGE